jgi:hypothetical protein
MAKKDDVKDALKEMLGEMKAEILEAVDSKLAVVKPEPVAEDEPEEVSGSSLPGFDPKKPRAVRRKIRCIGPRLDPEGVPVESRPAAADRPSKEVCGTVYLRLMENADNATPGDVRCTHKVCPTCGSDKHEELVGWKQHGENSPNITIKRTRAS